MEGGSLRPTVKKLGSEFLASWAWSTRLGLMSRAEGPGGRPPALVRPSSRLVGAGGLCSCSRGAGAVLHGVINLLTQGSAGDAVVCDQVPGLLPTD